MNIKRCENGHSYDGNIYSSCPRCGITLSRSVADICKEEDRPTEAVGGPYYPSGDVTVPVSDEEKTISAKDEDPNDDKDITVGLFGEEENHSPTVGWLVCEEGPERGRDYRIRPEKNSIGRGSTNDIMICDDRDISKDGHAIILYDPRGNRFYVLPGKGEFTVNGGIVNDGMEVFENDVLKIGGSRFVLIPYCKGDRKW